MPVEFLFIQELHITKREVVHFRQPLFLSGKTGIRTLEPRKGLTVFETAPFDHSGIFPMVNFRFAGAKLDIFS